MKRVENRQFMQRFLKCVHSLFIPLQFVHNFEKLQKLQNPEIFRYAETGKTSPANVPRYTVPALLVPGYIVPADSLEVSPDESGGLVPDFHQWRSDAGSQSRRKRRSGAGLPPVAV